MSNQGASHHRQRSNRSSTDGNRPILNVHSPSQTQSLSRRGSPGSDPSAVNPALNELRLVLLGKTGAGKSATGNSILGNRCFNDELSMSSVTKECKSECATVEGRELVLVDTPGFFDTDLTTEELQQEVIHCLALSSPGPHAFLLVIPIERYTEEQQRTVQMILEMFREDIAHHSILIFSHADRLGGESIESFVSRQNAKVQELVERFGRRFVAFDNTNPTNREQVRRLLQKVDQLLVMNENRHFTNEVTQAMQEAQRIIEERTQAERTRKIKEEVRKMADLSRAEFIAAMNQEREKTERKRKLKQARIAQIQMEIKKEEQNLQRFRASLSKEEENLRREMKKDMEIIEKEEKKMKELEIWIQEEERRRLSEAGQGNWMAINDNKKKLFMLTIYLLGLGAGFAPTLLAFLFPAAPAVEAGLSAGFLAKLLGLGAAQGGGFGWAAAGVARAAGVKLAMMTRCSIQ